MVLSQHQVDSSTGSNGPIDSSGKQFPEYKANLPQYAHHGQYQGKDKGKGPVLQTYQTQFGDYTSQKAEKKAEKIDARNRGGFDAKDAFENCLCWFCCCPFMCYVIAHMPH